jgi:hypothetical protein
VRGEPVQGSVRLTPFGGDRKASSLRVPSNYDGKCSISGVPPGEYEIDVCSDLFKVLPATFFVDGPDDVELGDIAAQPNVANSDFKVEQIVVDPLVIRSADAALLWSEMTFFNLLASVEYEDGTHVQLLTDGLHVGLVDRDGRMWFTRLCPAAS